MTSATSVEAPPPGVLLLFRTMESLVSAFALGAAAELGIADALADAPRTADDVARAVGAHPPSVRRLLRVLAPTGVVAEEEPGRFALTPLGTSLRTGVADSLVPMFRLFTRFMVRPLAETAQTIRTGEPAFERVFGAPLYEFLEAHPEEDAAFGRAMGVVRAIGARITDAYDFSGVRVLVDVGGGQGWRMVEVLQAHPELRGVLFDRPGVVEEARQVLQDAGVAGRCEVVAGNFFESVPDGGDCYLLSGVLPNWDDASARAILGNVRTAMPTGARLLLFEPILPEGDEPHLAKVLDLLMLVLLGGQVRTATHLGELFIAAGLRLNRAIPTGSPFAVVEALPA
jgi:hypothetical protein